MAAFWRIIQPESHSADYSAGGSVAFLHASLVFADANSYVGRDPSQEREASRGEGPEVIYSSAV
jgi:hypothetical protein